MKFFFIITVTVTGGLEHMMEINFNTDLLQIHKALATLPMEGQSGPVTLMEMEELIYYFIFQVTVTGCWPFIMEIISIGPMQREELK
jgi:hypothetical protein